MSQVTPRNIAYIQQLGDHIFRDRVPFKYKLVSVYRTNGHTGLNKL